MEQGEIKDYAQVEKIDRIRRANAQRHVSALSASSLHIASRKQMTKATKSMPCQYYNQGSCAHLKSHDMRGTLYKHIYTHCFATSGKTFTHPESQCRNKQKNRQNTKNLGYESWYPYPSFWHTSFSYQKCSPCSTNSRI